MTPYKNILLLVVTLTTTELLFNDTAVLAQADTTTVTEKTIYTYVEQMPAYQGGEKVLLQFIGSNIKYSKSQP